MTIEKPYDYAALMVRVSAGFVIFISLSLILLVVGNLIYTSFTDRIVLKSKRSR
ncbi:Protein CBG19107 [Caenorhabditis briggsae]|uniref:Protein CBG19107 n=1 Tax=Caenorhabditis briggsae TaxID=6238 RepID=A8XUT5_CAEBR|nr:Protein CBG19107 [Caenorhabditis briggsae]CAP36408.1 Protein CBG19107 [Caenorhabditis briggsae]